MRRGGRARGGRVPPARRVGVFLLIASLVYASGLLLWPLVDAPCASGLAGVSRLALFDAIGDDARLRVAADPDEPGAIDLAVIDVASGRGAEIGASVRFLLWRPLVILVALICATPVSLSDRFGSLALSLPILFLLTLARIWLRGVTLALDVEAVDPPGVVEGGLRFLDDVARTGAANLLLEPLILWGLITLIPARAELISMLRRTPPDADQPTGRAARS